MLYRLGLPIFQAKGPCVACRAPSDIYCDHAISCGSRGERISQHNHLHDALYHAAVTASLGPSREDRALLPGRENKPADVFIPLWAPGGRDLALDVTVASPFQQQALERGAKEPGYALKMRFQQKQAKYGQDCAAEGIFFLSVVFETTGAVEEEGGLLIKRLAKAMAKNTNQEDSEATRHLFGKLSILLAKDNASLVLNRVPTFPDPGIDGQL